MSDAYLPGDTRQRIQDLIKDRKITQSEQDASSCIPPSPASLLSSIALYFIRSSAIIVEQRMKSSFCINSLFIACFSSVKRLVTLICPEWINISTTLCLLQKMG